jgi:hypothetical protein
MSLLARPIFLNALEIRLDVRFTEINAAPDSLAWHARRGNFGVDSPHRQTCALACLVDAEQALLSSYFHVLCLLCT